MRESCEIETTDTTNSAMNFKTTHTADINQDAIPVVDNRFGSGSGPIFLNRLNCEGGESNILDCESPQLVHFCSHEEDVGVVCPG